MAVPTILKRLIGTWRGDNRLWLRPEQPFRASESTVEINLTAQGRFALIRYTWSYEGQPQDGMLLVGQEPAHRRVQGVWVDSWHMGDQFMLCEGSAEPNGVWVKGSYPAPPDPDWGWQITIESHTDSAFRMVMHNISPEGSEMLAVETICSRIL